MLNEVKLIGRLGQDPELKYLPSGSAVCNLSVATTESWTDKNTNQKQEKTEWHKVIFFAKPAEIINQYSKKGSLLYVSGKLTTRSWEDKDGNKRYTTEISGKDFKFLGGNSQNTSVNNSGGLGDSPTISDGWASDDIPF